MSSDGTGKPELSTLGGFVAGALAACGAVTITNPIEVVKTRKQLQGELAAKSAAPKIYRGLIQSLKTIFKHEGIRGCQKGLSAAYFYQIGLNGCRLGLYDPIANNLAEVLYGDRSQKTTAINVTAGAVSGIMGATVGSPLFLVKTRMQVYSPAYAVGTQTYYKSVWDGLSTIYSGEGMKGLFRGVNMAAIRTGMGSSVQLPIYNYAKSIITSQKWMQPDYKLHLVSSAISGFGVAVVMNPPDFIMTRMYNQRGNLYNGIIDCLLKTIKVEGVFALYKGFGAQVMRICPHTTLTLTFLEQTHSMMKYFEGVVD